MDSTIHLGKIERVNIRDIWKNEAQDFTPWLCQPENLTALSKAVGFELEFQEKEFHIGDFRLDILARVKQSGEPVVIENQFSKTDHWHLGQLLTYAAGVGEGGGAKVVIWLAEDFAEPHRSALDWLNRVTDPSIQFFGIEIELWRIGLSEPAPRFNLVCRPNISQKQLSQQTALSATDLLYQDFWKGFLVLCAKEGSTLRLPSLPPAQSWLSTAIGKTGFGVNLNARKRTKDLECQLWIDGAATSAFPAILAKRDEIVSKLGPQVGFDEMSKSACKVFETSTGDITDREQWPAMFRWLKERGEAYTSLFTPLVKQLKSAQ
jgi:Domain of unknown function (DUF4268)